MGNKYDQSKQAKEKFKSPILDYMIQKQKDNPDKPITKWEIAATFNISERAARHSIEKIANYYPIIATSDKEGYQILLFNEEMTKEEMLKTREAYKHQLNELMSRADSLFARMHPIIAACAVLDQLLEEKGK